MDAVTLPVAFLAGIVSFASPCFLPIIPVFLTYLIGEKSPAPVAAGAGSRGGQLPGVGQLPARGSAGGFITAADRVAAQNAIRTARPAVSRRRALANTAAFVAAFTAVFVGLWVAIATLGWAAGGLKPALRVSGGIVLLVLGVYTLGWLPLPALDRTWRSGAAPVGEPTPVRSALMGLAFGAGWSPCIGPVLGAIIGLALTKGSLLAGTGLLLVYSAGLGLPFVLLALGATGVTERLSWFTRHQKAVQTVSGILLLLVGFLLLTDLLAPLSSFTWLNL